MYTDGMCGLWFLDTGIGVSGHEILVLILILILIFDIDIETYDAIGLLALELQSSL